ncbi:MAG: DNA polymerase III subunit delta' [Rhodospirillales bacterium]|nr:DNA polymerase III subunit delta' [Rhodospirillales bacterium]
MFDDFEDDLLDDDTAPITAAVSGLQPPRQMSECRGHDRAEKSLLEMIDKDCLPHALIFSGPKGIGKSTMAFRLARYLLKNGHGDSADGGLFGDDLPKEAVTSLAINPDDPIFWKVASGGHPDLLTIERLFDEKKGRFKDTVEVNEIRRITPFMRMTASQGGWRIVIVDDADTMNRNAQNAILKILEEPPPNALLILVCHRLGAMIPTIRSRARVVPFNALEHDDFVSLVGKEHGTLPQSDMDVLYNISGGSVGQGLHIADEGGLEAVEKITALLYGWPHWQWSQIHILAENLGRKGQEDSLQAFQDVLMWMVNSLLRAKARNEVPQSPLNNDATQKLLAHYSLQQWIEITSQLQEHFDMVTGASLDKRHAVIGAFSVFDTKEAA